MKISKRVDYGLRAMVHLAKSLPAGRQSKNKKAISIREIANKEGIPFEFLSKIFAKLEKAKLVQAKHGASGGYLLAKSANKITPANIVTVLEGNIVTANCCGCLMVRKCISKDVIEKVQQSLDSALGAITLANLINKKK